MGRYNYSVEKLIAKLPEINNKDQTEKQFSTLRSFCFYLALAYQGMVNLTYSRYNNLINATQAWRLSPELEFSLQFLQLLTVCDNFTHPGEEPQQNRAGWVVFGHMLPMRVFQTKHDTQQLNSISKRQYILLTDIVMIRKPKSECSRKEIPLDKSRGQELVEKMQFFVKWFEVSPNLRLFDLKDYKLGILDVFKKENCTRGNLPQFLKEAVGSHIKSLGKESTFLMNHTVFDDLNLLEMEKKDFVFNSERRVWVVNPELHVKDTISQIYKGSENMDDQAYKADEFIV